MKVFLLLLAALVAASPCRANSALLNTVNSVRMRACSASASRVPLQNSPKLQSAAARVAAGTALQSALAAAGYLASESEELHFSGALSDAQISRTLASRYCSTLTDPKLREMGAERRGNDVWMVLAAPVPLPTTADAPSISQHILDWVNKARAAGRRCGANYFAPAAPLTLNASLTSAAFMHSRDMAGNNEFDHRGHDGSTPAVRVKRAGYGPFRIVGENIAAGPMTPAEVTAGWLASPAHCENIMDGRFTQIGIAFATNLNTAAGVFWTQDFATPR